MIGTPRRIGLLLLFAMSWAPLLGCRTVSPTLAAYPFIVEDEDLAEFVPQVYNARAIARNPNKIAACFTEPQGYKIDFHGSLARRITDDQEECTLFFGPGVYPFELKPRAKGQQPLCGAMMVVNVNETVALATFGKSADTKLFPPDVISKAKDGVLAEYTISFDGQPVIKYWLGNRRKLYAGGKPNAELDFSAVRGLHKVRVAGSSGKDLAVVARAYAPQPADAGQAGSPSAHRLEIDMANGAKYRGYVRNLTANDYTAFARVPCTIPSRLFDAADRGTIAKFTVFSGTLRREEVAEIVFGRE